MAEYCTCGAELPPDARFCHKCGKPQREEPVIVVEAPRFSVPSPVVEAPPPAPPKFHTGLAFIIGLLTAPLLLILTWLLPPASVLWLVFIGFLAVYVYKRRAGALSLAHGARVGFIAGLISFLLFGLPGILIMSNQDLVRQVLDQPGVAQQYREQFQQVMEMPVAALAFAFAVMFLGFPSLGGMLGAKLLKKG